MIGYAVTASITIAAGATSMNGQPALRPAAVGQMRLPPGPAALAAAVAGAAIESPVIAAPLPSAQS